MSEQGEIKRARDELIECVRKWRETPCSSPRVGQPHPGNPDDRFCDGENHVEGCAVEAARQDLLAAADHLDMVEGRT